VYTYLYDIIGAVVGWKKFYFYKAVFYFTQSGGKPLLFMSGLTFFFPDKKRNKKIEASVLAGFSSVYFFIL